MKWQYACLEKIISLYFHEKVEMSVGEIERLSNGRRTAIIDTTLEAGIHSFTSSASQPESIAFHLKSTHKLLQNLTESLRIFESTANLLFLYNILNALIFPFGFSV